MAEKKVKNKVRIVVRQPDGSEFSWTPLLSKKTNMRPGWKYCYEDGTFSVELVDILFT